MLQNHEFYKRTIDKQTWILYAITVLDELIRLIQLYAAYDAVARRENMKVLITSDWYVPTVNGVVTSVVNLHRGLEAMGHEVRILTLSQSAHSRAEGPVTAIGAIGAGRIYPGARLRTAPGTELLQELVKWKPDIIHTQCEFSTFLIARKLSALTGAPIVHTYHTMYEDYTHYFSPSRRWGRKAVSVFSRWVVNQTACVIAPTVKVRRLLEGYQVSRPIHVIPTGIDLSRFCRPVDEIQMSVLRRSLDIPQDAFVMVYVGRLAEEKNISELLHQTAALSGANIRLLLVGDGPYREALESQVQALGLTERVIFTGMVPPAQVADYYRLGDVFVSASSSETQGLTYLEALASGLPALCRRDECLEGVIRDGINGWQYQDSAQFRRHLQQLMDDPSMRMELSRNAAELAQRAFSYQAFAAAAAAVYQQVLGLHPSSAGAA